MSKAYLNALMEEGTKDDCFRFLIKLDKEVDRLRAGLNKIIAEDREEYTYALGPYARIAEKALKE